MDLVLDSFWSHHDLVLIFKSSHTKDHSHSAMWLQATCWGNVTTTKPYFCLA